MLVVGTWVAASKDTFLEHVINIANTTVINIITVIIISTMYIIILCRIHQTLSLLLQWRKTRVTRVRPAPLR